MRVLITGITGTLGSKVREKLTKLADIEVVGISRDEQKQNLLPFHPRFEKKICDVTDFVSLERLGDVDVIGHFAALKCVDVLEANPTEAFRVNVQGTANITRLGIITGARVVLASTDKAFHPINNYGFSKAMAEKIVLDSSELNAVCRYGNVLGSRGSVVRRFVETLLKDRVIYITDPRMTRFWITVDRACDFVCESILDESTTGLRIPEIKACNVTDIGRATAKILGLNNYRVETIGIRPGEKLHEYLDKDLCSEDPLLQMRLDEICFTLKPIIEKIRDQCVNF